MTATPALDWLLRGGLCSHETRATCPVCSRTEAARVELDALLAERYAALAGREMWKALAVSAERGHDAERLERVRALLADATRALEGER